MPQTIEKPDVDLHVKRLQFDFPLEALSKLDRIKDKLGLGTRAATVRNALRMYEWFATQVDPESTIIVEDKNSKRLAQFPVALLLK